jgi:hypothetical protein
MEGCVQQAHVANASVTIQVNGPQQFGRETTTPQNDANRGDVRFGKNTDIQRSSRREPFYPCFDRGVGRRRKENDGIGIANIFQIVQVRCSVPSSEIGTGWSNTFQEEMSGVDQYVGMIMQSAIFLSPTNMQNVG